MGTESNGAYPNVKIKENYVLVLPDRSYDEDLENGLEISDAFNPAYHWSVHGTVLAIPEKLSFNKYLISKLKRSTKRVYDYRLDLVRRLYHKSTEYDTDMQVKVGDRVVFNYMSQLTAKEEGAIIEGGACLMRYDALYMAKRGNEGIMLNGFILVEPIELSEQELSQIGVGLKIALRDNLKEGYGIVRKMGIPNRSYLSGKYSDGVDLHIGQLVGFDKSNQVTMEWQYHKKENGGKKAWFKMQRKDVFALF
jgi:hypothetical protein